jgi:hypothetical protein
MTLDQAAKMVDGILQDRKGETFHAIRFLRREGLSFRTAKNMVLEIKNGAAWWKKSIK